MYLTILTGLNARERYLIYILTGEHRMSDVSLSNDMTANSTASLPTPTPTPTVSQEVSPEEESATPLSPPRAAYGLTPPNISTPQPLPAAAPEEIAPPQIQPPTPAIPNSPIMPEPAPVVPAVPVAPEAPEPAPVAAAAAVEPEEEEQGESFYGLTGPELLRRWDQETDMAVRDELIKELQRQDLFPSEAQTAWEMSTGAYPDLKDPVFLQKLLARREFADSLQTTWKQKTNPCQGSTQDDFEATPVQRFVANFLSPKTPYNSALLYHGVGVGKTCAAITIAEAWLQFYPREKVFLLAPPNIQPGFLRTIFDKSRLQLGLEDGEVNRLTGCTGNAYLELTGNLFEREVSKIEFRIAAEIRRRYAIFGYLAFANYVRDLFRGIPEGIPDERRLMLENEILRKNFSGKLIIIDEAHNIRDVNEGAMEGVADEDAGLPGGKDEIDDATSGKRLTPLLDQLLSVAEGMKLILLTATPMYNSYREIIFLLNILLKNDKMATLRDRDIFEADGTFRPGGEERLGLVAQRYVSFMRGENPQSFPLRLEPDDLERIAAYPVMTPRGAKVPVEETYYTDFLPLVTTELASDALEAVRELSDELESGEGGISALELSKIVQAGNFIVPNTAETLDAGIEGLKQRTSVAALRLHFAVESAGSEPMYRALRTGGARWLGLDQLSTYSAKFAKFIGYLQNAEGVVFAYTRFVGAGALPLALALEANGYTPWGRRVGLLADGIQVPGGRQCALCPKKEMEHRGAEQTHMFVPAKYALLTGDKQFSPKNDDAIKTEKSPENKDGEIIKVVIGSQVAAEGVDLKYIREVHVLDSWFHLNKTEQIIGRGIRFCSHSLLPEEQRNTTIYLHAAVRPEEDDMESGDLYSYRVAFRKGEQVGRVSRVMKQYAVDCNLNHDAIIIKGTDPVYQIDAQGNERAVSMNDTPFTAICDWMEKCDYQCVPSVPVKTMEREDISYDEYAARWREADLRKKLRLLFQRQTFYRLEDLWNIFEAEAPKSAIVDLLLGVVGNRAFKVENGGRSGYIIYRNKYYIFQPDYFVDLNIPLSLRVAALPVKRDSYQPAMMSAFARLAPGPGPAPVQKIKRSALLAAPTGGPGAEAAAPAAAAALPTRTAIATETGMDLTALHTYLESWMSWVDVISEKADEASIFATSPGLDIETHILFQVDNNEKKKKKRMERLKLVPYIAAAIHGSTGSGWTDASRAAFKKIAMEFAWDEELTPKEQKLLITEVPVHPVVAATATQNFLTAGSVSAIRHLDMIRLKLEYLCRDSTGALNVCAPTVVSVITQPKYDTLKQLALNKETTGLLYGFLVPKGDEIVFKTGVPPAVGGKTGRGQECANVSTTTEHLNKLMEMGTILLEVAGQDMGLTTAKMLDVRDKSRYLSNTNMMCTLLDLVLRYMDAMRIQDQRWFYRTIAANITGHLGR